MKLDVDTVLQLFASPRRFSNAATPYCLDLMREFLRREALWANVLGVADRLPFPDLPAIVSPTTCVSVDHEGLVDSFARSTTEIFCCLYILKWYQIPKSVVQMQSPFLPANPYFPLLKFFELGGFFTAEHRINIDINGSRCIHAGMVQHGTLDSPFAVFEDE